LWRKLLAVLEPVHVEVPVEVEVVEDALEVLELPEPVVVEELELWELVSDTGPNAGVTVWQPDYQSLAWFVKR